MVRIKVGKNVLYFQTTVDDGRAEQYPLHLGFSGTGGPDMAAHQTARAGSFQQENRRRP